MNNLYCVSHISRYLAFKFHYSDILTITFIPKLFANSVFTFIYCKNALEINILMNILQNILFKRYGLAHAN